MTCSQYLFGKRKTRMKYKRDGFCVVSAFAHTDHKGNLVQMRYTDPVDPSRPPKGKNVKYRIRICRNKWCTIDSLYDIL